MEYRPISKEEVLSALVSKFGGAETVRFLLADAMDDLQSIGVGIAENNPMKASAGYESLRNNLMQIRMLVEKKETKPAIEKIVRDATIE